MKSLLASKPPLEPAAASTHHPAWRLSWMIALLVILKSVYLGFFVIPPADIPDESGHYAYIKDIASGTLFPLLGTSTIPNDLWRDPPNKEITSTRTNYIVQHPPLYYAIAAIPYAIASKFTDDRWYLIRITRLVSALSLGLTILVVFRTLIDAGLNPGHSLLLSTTIAFIPTLNSLSAGITNDAFLLMVCAVATRYLVRFVLNNRLKDAYLCAIWLTLAGATKMTAWIMIAGFVAVIVYELRQPIKAWMLHSVGITAVSLLAPLWWIGRNLMHFGDPFYIGISSNVVLAQPGVTLWQFLESQPFFYFMLVHFYALFGFSGYCQTPDLVHLCQGIRLTHIVSGPFFVFLSILTLLTLLMLWFVLKQGRNLSKNHLHKVRNNSIHGWANNLLPLKSSGTIAVATSLTIGTIVYIYAMFLIHKEPGLFGGWLVNGVSMAPLLIAPFSLIAIVLAHDEKDRLPHHLILVFLLFGIIFVLQALKSYVLVGEMRGVQGRYFFPFIPMLLAATSAFFAKYHFPARFTLWIAITLMLSEIYAYVHFIIPFHVTVRI